MSEIELEAQNESAIEKATNIINRLIQSLQHVIRGRNDTISLLITALIADGHVLIEDYPGSGKTTLTKTLGGLIAKEPDSAINTYNRIQFTPDMLPGDVLGVTIFDPNSCTFNFKAGPVFANIILADEINRTGPKVQAAFLECMAEKQVTLDNVTYPLDELFFVIGTQNPLDMAGTYPLPLVQLDRFLLKIPMNYVDAKTEFEILSDHEEITKSANHPTPVCTRNEILEVRKVAKTVTISQNLRQAIIDIVQATRNNELLQFGASTRSALMLQAALRAWALVHGRSYANADDLKYITPFVMLHRLRFHGAAGDPLKALKELITPQLEKLIKSEM